MNNDQDWEVNIKPNGVSIRTRPQQVLFDAEGNEVIVPGQNHRQAIAVGSFESPEAFTAHLDSLMESNFGKGLQSIVTSHMIVNEAIEDEREVMRGERDEAQGQRDVLQEQLDQAREERDILIPRIALNKSI